MARPRKNQETISIEARPNLETPGLLEIDSVTKNDDNVIPFIGPNSSQPPDQRDTTEIDSVLAQFGIHLV